MFVRVVIFLFLLFVLRIVCNVVGVQWQSILKATGGKKMPAFAIAGVIAFFVLPCVWLSSGGIDTWLFGTDKPAGQCEAASGDSWVKKWDIPPGSTGIISSPTPFTVRDTWATGSNVATNVLTHEYSIGSGQKIEVWIRADTVSDKITFTRW